MATNENDPMNVDLEQESKKPLFNGDENLPWVEKYRPKVLADLVAHNDIISTIQKFIDLNALPHLLLHGPPGTGKTSTIIACARQMFFNKSLNQFVLELNASDARGIDVVREQIKQFVSTRTMFVLKAANGTPIPKLVILDEADNMTSAAQFSLRRIIEQYSYNARFCLICNYSSKIISALQSRCTKFRFGPVPPDEARRKVEKITSEEGLAITQDGMNALLDVSQGDMRRVLNNLQAAHLGHEGEEITEEVVYRTVGLPTPAVVEEVLDVLMTKDISKCVKLLRETRVTFGYSLLDTLSALHRLCVQLILPPRALNQLMRDIAEIEWRLAAGSDEHIQSMALAGVFHEIRDIVASK